MMSCGCGRANSFGGGELEEGVVQFRALGEGANAENARVFGCEHIMHKQSGKSDD